MPWKFVLVGIFPHNQVGHRPTPPALREAPSHHCPPRPNNILGLKAGCAALSPTGFTYNRANKNCINDHLINYGFRFDQVRIESSYRHLGPLIRVLSEAGVRGGRERPETSHSLNFHQARAGLSPNRLRNLFARFRTHGLIVDRFHLNFHHVSGCRQLHRSLFKLRSRLIE